MSQPHHPHSEEITTILLPGSGVDFFALDEGTAACARKLVEDWRFARVRVRVESAGIDAAIARYGSEASPELIVIETNDISQNFISRLGELANVCAAGTDAVIIGPENDVHLYRSLVEMGIKDYLVRPVSDEDMLKVVARTLVEKRGLSGSRLVAVAGGKGGVGVTAVAQALAWNIAEGLGHKTVLLDAAGSGGTLGLSYGLDPAATLAEAVRIGGSGSEDDMRRICQSAGEHLSLLVSGGEPFLSDGPDADGFETLVNRLMQKFPIVVLDLSRASNAVQKRMLTRAAATVLVSTPLASALRGVFALRSELKTLKGSLKEIDVVINMQGLAEGAELPAKEIAKVNIEPAATIPWLPKIFVTGESMRTPAGKDKNAAAVLASLMPLAARAAGVDLKGAPAAKEAEAGFLKKLWSK